MNFSRARATPSPAATGPSTPLAPSPTSARSRFNRVLGGIRLRLVWWVIVLLALTTAASVLFVRQVLVQRLDARIDTELRQEVAEIASLARGRDPETGEPFAEQVDRIFDVFFERNIPAPYEAMLAILAGRSYRHAPELVQYRLDTDGTLVARWAGLSEPERGRTMTPAGEIDYLAVPLLVGEDVAGTFVVAIFRDVQEADVDAAGIAASIVGIAMLLVGSVLAVRLAERILAPVRLVTRTAKGISETDLARRIDVRGHDEISELSATFNEMLDRLDAAFAAQRRFIDDAGHELRTPITVIRGQLELMEDDPEDRRRTLELVDDELRRMSRIVDDLIMLARSEQPDFLRLRRVDVDELTVRMFDSARGLAPRDWQLDGVAREQAVLDEQRLMQAMLQLAENAVRYTPDTATIGVGSSFSAGELRFWVRDTGPGVPESERDQIFERFHRGLAAQARTEGAGLGLSIVRAIAEAHGGGIELDSTPGAGARFTIVLPMAVGDDETTEDEGDA